MEEVATEDGAPRQVNVWLDAAVTWIPNERLD